MTNRALIVAGGTGGHIFPGISIAKALQLKGWTVKWAGNPQAMEGGLVPKEGIELLPLVFQGFRGKGIVAQAFMPIRLLKAFFQSIRLLRQYKPQVVIGMGGYVAFPLGMMASLLNIRLVVHEQNSIAGLTNKVLAKLADLNLVAFPNALPGATWVGNPIREAIADMAKALPSERYSSRQGPLRLLVVGGSLGAQALNQLLPKALSALPEDKRPIVMHQAGNRHIEALRQAYDEAKVEAQAVAFIDDMAAEMANVDVVVCRAGAMTVAEVSALGVAALFVPFPYAVDDHQTHNAGYLVKSQAAWLIQEKDLSVEKFVSWYTALTREVCAEKAIKAFELGKREAAETMVALIENAVTS